MKMKLWIISALASLTAVVALAQDTAPAPAAGAKATPAAPTKKASQVKKKVKGKQRFKLDFSWGNPGLC